MRAFDRDEPFVKGLPRPVALAGEKLLPVPWSQAVDAEGPEWGIIDEPNQASATADGLCLVCGETVEDGVVLFHRELSHHTKENDHNFAVTHDGPLPYIFRKEDLDRFPWDGHGGIMDAGPLHTRCARLTRAHCSHIRERMQPGGCITASPYRA